MHYIKSSNDAPGDTNLCSVYFAHLKYQSFGLNLIVMQKQLVLVAKLVILRNAVLKSLIN